MFSEPIISYNNKHLSKGDDQPQFIGKLRIYNMRYCPYAHRVILVLNAKEVEYEVININLADKPEWYATVSTFGKVPALEIEENVTLCESLVISEYIDEKYPFRPLLPQDAVRKALDKIIIEACQPIYTMFYKIVWAEDTISDESVSDYNNGLKFLQDQLESRNTAFIHGEMPGFADYMIWPWFERLLMLSHVDERAKIDGEQFGVLLNYLGRMLEDPAVKPYILPKEAFLTVIEGYKPGNTPNYDLLTEDFE